MAKWFGNDADTRCYDTSPQWWSTTSVNPLLGKTVETAGFCPSWDEMTMPKQATALKVLLPNYACWDHQYSWETGYSGDWQPTPVYITPTGHPLPLIKWGDNAKICHSFTSAPISQMQTNNYAASQLLMHTADQPRTTPRITQLPTNLHYGSLNQVSLESLDSTMQK